MKEIFGEFGFVNDIEMPANAKGVAFVQFDSASDARQAMEEVTGKSVNGIVILTVFRR